MLAAPHSAQAAPAQGKTSGLRAHIQNIYRLIIKELRSIRADPMMLVLVAYAFSVAVYMVATGASTEARDLTIGVVDEDRSDLSGRLLGALNPPLIKRAVLINANEIDPNMDDGRLVFVLEIPPRFERDLLAGPPGFLAVEHRRDRDVAGGERRRLHRKHHCSGVGKIPDWNRSGSAHASQCRD